MARRPLTVLSGSERKGLSNSPVGGKGERGKLWRARVEPTSRLLGRLANRHEDNRGRAKKIEFVGRTSVPFRGRGPRRRGGRPPDIRVRSPAPSRTVPLFRAEDGLEISLKR